jgi:ABC-type amino acid transport substrate-binding protein
MSDSVNPSLDNNSDESAHRRTAEREGNEAVHPHSKRIDEIRIPIWKNYYLTLSVFIGLLTSLIGTTYAIVKYAEIHPLDKQIEELKTNKTAIDSENQGLKAKLDRLQQQYESIVTDTDRPVLTLPRDNASIIANDVDLEWDYKKHDSVSGYVLEIRNIKDSSSAPEIINVVRPETKRTTYQVKNSAGEYIWRVRPGTLIDGKVVSQGPWSHMSAFSTFSSNIDRIKSTQVITVASTPTSYDSYANKTQSGTYEGFEMDLARWIAKDLRIKLDLQSDLSVEIVEIPWNRFFSALQNGEVDLGIRSITKSKTRETEYSKVKFTVGYLQNHQIIIQSKKEGSFPASLNGQVIGVKAASINEKVANYLVGQFRFRVDPSYVSYDDIYTALREGRIAYGLVDSTLVSKFLNTKFYQFGPQLDSYLKPFYEKELGTSDEEYAIAVHESNPNQSLVPIINDILNSADTKSYIESLRQKYGR